MPKLHIFLNIFLASFIVWYFCIHIGLDVYYHKYFSPSETFIEDVYYQAKVQKFEFLNKILDKTKSYDVFVGDSNIESFPIHELFNSSNILNRGLGFETTASLLKRLEKTVCNINISRMFIMIGHNDIKYRGVDETIINYQKILNKVNASKIICINILPNMDQDVNAKTVTINNRLKAICDDRDNIDFLDVYSLFLDPDGNIANRYFYDGTHLMAEGYVIVKEALIKSYNLN